jgi:hypothetical protein
MVIIPFVAYELRKISDPKELERPEKLQLSNHNLLAKRTLSVRLRLFVFQGYHFSCVYPDLVLRAIKHIFLDILILPLGNLLRRTYR